MPTHNVWFER